VLIAPDQQASTVSVTWTLTEDANDVMTCGDPVVPTADLVHAGELFKEASIGDS
jgi:hypothetical protein